MSTTGTNHLHNVQKLKGASNYATWKDSMEMILIREDLWEVTSGESKRPGPWYESPSEASMPATERTPQKRPRNRKNGTAHHAKRMRPLPWPSWRTVESNNRHQRPGGHVEQAEGPFRR